jgi:hypothetical protein
MEFADKLEPFKTALLQSPVHRLLGNRKMLITIKDRETDRVYTVPAQYHEVDALVIVLVRNAQKRTWWQNFTQPGYASITIRGWRTSAQGFAPAPDSAIFREAARHALGGRRFIKSTFGIRLNRDAGLTPEQASKLAETTRIVVFDRTPQNAG